MKVKNIGLLKTLMEAQGVSARALAKAAGWKSQTSANRLLAGQAKTVKPEAAEAIARRLNVNPQLLFAPLTSRNQGRNVA